MPTIAGLRRRGYTPEAIRLMCERAGTSKAGGWTDYASLDAALRDDLDPKAPRAMAVLDPVELRLTNWAELFGSEAHREACHAPVHPQRPELGERAFALGPRLWIERDDFAEVPAKGFFRLFPGNRVRLKYGYVIECSGCEKDAAGRVTAVLATRRARHARAARPAPTRSRSRARSPGSAPTTRPRPRCGSTTACSPKRSPTPAARTSRRASIPNSLRVVTGYVEAGLANAAAEQRFQIERHGYFVTERVDHAPGRPVLQPDRAAARHLDFQVTRPRAARTMTFTSPCPSRRPRRRDRRRAARPRRGPGGRPR